MTSAIPAYWHWVALGVLVGWALVFRLRISLRSHLALLLALALGAGLFSWSVVMAPAVGNVSGRVLDADSDAPVARARVYYPGGEAWVRSDALGRFFMPGVPAAKRLRITVRVRGYRTSYDDRVSVVEGKETRGLEFRMSRQPPTLSAYNTMRVFTPSESPAIHFGGSVVERVAVDVYAADAVHDRSAVQDAAARRALVDRLASTSPLYHTVWATQPDADGDFDGTLTLPIHKPGLYVAQASVKGTELRQTAWFLVTSLGIVTRRSPAETLFYAQRLDSGQPVPGAHLTVYGSGHIVQSGVTGADGTWLWKGSGRGELRLLAQDGESYAYSRMDAVDLYGRGQGWRVYVYTERPIYRPGHEVFFRGVVRRDVDRRYRLPQGETVRVQVHNATGEVAYDRTLGLDAFGCFNGSLTLPQPAALGDWYLEAARGEVSTRTDFQVAEYRKPEFKVDLAPGKPRYNSGETVHVKVDARYFFGAPVTQAKVQYQVYESYYRWEHMQFLDLDADHAPEHYGGMTAEGKVALGADGTAELEFAPGPSDHDRDFWVQVDVEDPSHRKVSASTDVLVTLGEFYLSTTADRWGYEPGQKVKVDVSARDYQEKPRANVPVEARLVREDYREVTDARGVSTWQNRETEVWTGSGSTDARGRVAFTVAPPGAGSYQLRTSAPDDGKTIRDACWFFVAGGEGGPSFSARDLTLLLDKASYRPGDSVHAVIATTAPESWVLLNVEGRHLIATRVVHVTGHSAAVTLPVEAAYFPNVTVNAVLVRDKQLVSDQKELDVRSADARLQVAVAADRDSYEPGQTARLRIHVTDGQGRPVSAQLSLGVVDTAIYALAPDATPKIYDTFYGPEPSLVNTEYSFAPDYSGGRNKEEDDRVRRNFKDTAFWNPAVVTGADGIATVPVALPDNLTTWRATVRAVTMDSRVGEKTFDFLVKKPLLVRLEVPRFMGARDRMTISGVVHNQTGRAQTVTARIQVEGLTLASPLEQTATLPDGQAHAFDWTVAAETVGSARVTVSARAPGYGDAMALPFPILPHGVEQVATRAGIATSQSRRVDGKEQGGFSNRRAENASAELSLPPLAEVSGSSSRLTVYLSPSLAATAMQGLQYLTSYPYGCVEQTMSSFLPDIQVARALRLLHLDDAAVSQDLPKMVARGLQRLYDYQHGDGGWGWWHDDPTHPYLTAYVVYGLHTAREAGFAVRSDVYDRGVAALKRLLKEDRGEFRDASGAVQQRTRWNTRAYMVYVLSAIGEKPGDDTIAVGRHEDALNAYTRALLALAFWNQGQGDEARAVLGRVMRDADETATSCHWDTRTVDYSWVENPIEATAFVLRAMMAVSPDDPRVDKTLRWLVDNRRGDCWTSTRDTGAVIAVMTEYLLAKRGELKPDFTAVVTLNGRTAAEVPVKAPLLGAAGVIELPPGSMQDGDNLVKIEAVGGGTLYWSTAQRGWSQAENVPAADAGFKLTRSYAVVTVKDGSEVEAPLTPGAAIPLGARVRVRVRVENAKPYPYVMIEDPIAPGFELTTPEADRNTGGGWWIGREVHDDRVCVFATRMEAGVHEMTYDVWAEAPGDYHVRPAVASLMYTPEVRGNSAESRLEIGAAK